MPAAADAVLALARAEIRALKPYEHAAWDPALERLHANELPWRTPVDASLAGLNRYPEPQPHELVAKLAALYGVAAEQLLVSRGSDEAIDLLVRAFCRAGSDAVLVTPPTFGMYAVAARIQGAAVVSVPLRPERGYALEVEAVIEALGRPAPESVKLVFLCTPNNPTGNAAEQDAVTRLLAAAAGRALVVIDEAYVEFAAQPSFAGLLPEYPHLVILRTLSKAHGLAGARVGALLARPEIVALLRKIIPPYAMAQPTIEAALQALSPPALAVCRQRVATLVAERERVATGLRGAPNVRRVWPSAANYLLVEFHDAELAFQRACAARLLVRDLRRQVGLEAGLRISVGTPEQNTRLLASLGGAS
jgi:histidinol-phosphate aminotransferase